MKRMPILLLVATLLWSGADAFAQAPDTLARIKAAKAINVGYAIDSPPFSFVGPDKAPTGFSIDLCTQVIAAIGRAVNDTALRVNWVPGTTAERLTLIESGKLDLECANTTRTLTRMRTVDFSSLVFIDSGGLLVRGDVGATRLTDLKGKKIAVIKGTTTERRLADQLRIQRVNADVVTVRDGNEGLTRLDTGFVDAFASDKIKLVTLASQSPKPQRLELMGEDLSFEPYAFALPRGDTALRYEVDRALAQIYGSAEMERIFDRWLGKLGRPTGLLAAVYILNTIPE